MPSPFLNPGTTSKEDNLAVLFLRRDQLIPTVLRAHDDENLGYDEGKVVNTRFGSFPHSTLIGKPWGSQILASKVDTGSRGRRPQPAKKGKRKADEIDSPGVAEASPSQQLQQQKEAVVASSGFTHLLPPTPESWTTSLPHRTQVVYTPDYSYILHRLRARPGSTVIEAGAGSGSFTHAAVRAVFNGYPSEEQQPARKRRRMGKVCSFEFHPQRAEKVREEIQNHGLTGLVEVNHRDVYNDGFFLPSEDSAGQTSPKANAIFLDLPAPWLALKHLVRDLGPDSPQSSSPLDPSSTVHICTFSPCLEQAQRTISTLRQFGWISISMVEISQRRIEVRREKYGVEDPRKQGGGTVGPKSVEEAVSRQRDLDEKWKSHQEATQRRNNSSGTPQESEPTPPTTSTATTPAPTSASQQENQQQATPSSQPAIPLFAQGALIHRSEPDLRTHTSYLVFALLPRSWSNEDEQKCRQKWPSSSSTPAKAGAASEPSGTTPAHKTRRQLKKEAYEERKRLRGETAAAVGNEKGTESGKDVATTGEEGEEDVEMVDS